MRFWDSSALVPLITMEAATARAQQLYRADPQILAWAFTELEMLSALCRRHREGRLDARDLELSVSKADFPYERIDALCAIDSPGSTPFDGTDPGRADEYRKVFRLGYFKAWDRHLM